MAEWEPNGKDGEGTQADQSDLRVDSTIFVCNTTGDQSADGGEACRFYVRIGYICGLLDWAGLHVQDGEKYDAGCGAEPLHYGIGRVET